jgi:hypothetical protein
VLIAHAVLCRRECLCVRIFICACRSALEHVRMCWPVRDNVPMHLCVCENTYEYVCVSVYVCTHVPVRRCGLLGVYDGAS